MAIDLDDPRLTAYALGELDDATELAAVEALLAAHPEARQAVDEIRTTGDLLRRELAAEAEHAAPVRDLTIHRAVEHALRPRRRRPWGLLSLAAGALILGGTALLTLPNPGAREASRPAAGPVATTPRYRTGAEARATAEAATPATTPADEREVLAANLPEPATPDVLLRAAPRDRAMLRERVDYDAAAAPVDGQDSARLGTELAVAAPATDAPADAMRMAPAAMPPAAMDAGAMMSPAATPPAGPGMAAYYGRAAGGRTGSDGAGLNDNYAFSRSATTGPAVAGPSRANAPAAPPIIAGYALGGAAPASQPTVMLAPAAAAPANGPVVAMRTQPGQGQAPAMRGAQPGQYGQSPNPGQPGQTQPSVLRSLGETLAKGEAAPASAPVLVPAPAPLAVAAPPVPGAAAAVPLPTPVPPIPAGAVAVRPAGPGLATASEERAQVAVKRLKRQEAAADAAAVADPNAIVAPPPAPPAVMPPAPPAPPVGAFAPLVENPFVRTLDQPQSTFALDVDTASYAIVRRYLTAQNALPPKDAVRVEELVNAFKYDDPAPKGEDPVAVDVEIARSPWNAENRLARISVAGRAIPAKDRPRANLVFLIDVSGSMDEPDKLPLLKRGMTMLTEQLGEGDRVAIVTYSNTAQVVLPPTRGDQRRAILSALEELKPGGSTNGAGGLELAYGQAAAAFLEEGANRVILASDGDFNVGETDNDKLVGLIRDKAKARIFLTVLGFGSGNLQDARLEKLADEGNGNYHYIDSPREARRVLVRQVSGTLVTVAKDVKLQVDFNPAKVGAYRLIGYENRLMPAQDFRDDRKDGGELGAGQAVCALYELVPAGREGPLAVAAPSRFVKPAEPAKPDAPESFTVGLRWKPPEGDVSTGREVPAVDLGRDYAEASESFRWAAAVASFGQILRESAFRGTATLDGVLEQAGAALGSDPRGERSAFLDLVRKAKVLGAK